MELVLKIFQTILSVVAILILYRYVYMAIGFFGKAKKFKEAETEHKFAVVICAKNEEKVIGNLLDSIKAQNYPQDKLHVFVIADNCDDNTASIAAEKGATVYERHDAKHARKGWALEFGFHKIREEFGIDGFEGYCIFDADNLLHPDYMREMNKAFDEGKLDVIQGYRNTKNFDTNWISASYGLFFYRQSAAYHRPRQILHTSTNLSGTGYLIRSRALEEGWRWASLTEDTQFTMHLVSSGMKVGYCEAAEFFDEQPTDLRTTLRQRLRWSKGRIYAFFAYGYKLVAGLFRKKTNKWSCYDMFFSFFPYGLGTALLAIASFLISFITMAVNGGFSAAVAEYTTVTVLKTALIALGIAWGSGMLVSALVAIRERKKIRCGKAKLVWYIVISPWFDLIGTPLSVVSLFMHVTWKKIKHVDDKKIEDVISVPAIKEKNAAASEKTESE